jgi:uncharacterized protein YbaR (Trm112 family)
MHILLTDVASCPHCGPAHGLIVMSQRTESRRVLEGVLGCPNCRRTYPIRAGRVDFAEGAAADDEGGSADPSEAVRYAALAGVTEGPAWLLLAGPAAVHAPAIAAMLEGVEIIAAGYGADGAPDVDARVNAISLPATGLPFVDSRMAAVVLSGAAADRLLEEGARVLAVLGRLVLDPAPAQAADRLAAVGLHMQYAQDGVVIAGLQPVRG